MVSQTVIASFQLISQAGKFFLKYSWTYQPQTVWTVATAFLKLGKVAGRNETLGMVTWAINYSNDNDVFFEVQTVQWFRLKPIRTWSAWAWRQRRETRVSHGVLASVLLLTGSENSVRFFSQSQNVAKKVHSLCKWRLVSVLLLISQEKGREVFQPITKRGKANSFVLTLLSTLFFFKPYFHNSKAKLTYPSCCSCSKPMSCLYSNLKSKVEYFNFYFHPYKIGLFRNKNSWCNCRGKNTNEQ